MSGSTVFMAPVMDSSSGLSRSHSTSEIMSGSSFAFRNSHAKSPRQAAESTFDLSFDDSFTLDTSFYLRDVAEPSSPATTWRPSDSDAEVEANLDHQHTLRRSRAGSLMDRPRSWFPGTRAVAKHAPQQPMPRPVTSVGDDGTSDGGRRLSSASRGSDASDSFVNFTKRSWLSSGKSSTKQRPKTAKKEISPDNTDADEQKPVARRRTDLVSEKKAAENRMSEPPRPSMSFKRASSFFSKKTKQAIALSKSNNNTDSDSFTSSAASLAQNGNEGRDSQSTAYESNTTVNDDSCTDMAPAPPKDNDPLWSSFKNLEVEHKSFASKSTPQRIIQIQTIVLPFLRSSMDHASTKELSPEDVDRRATILHKWWISILDMMDGIGMASVPAMDRPVLFAALTDVMMRPEWRQTTPYFLPLKERSPRERVRSRAMTNASQSTTDSEQAMFLAESAEHNVRTMFVNTLAKQLSFVIEKMGMRHAPGPLVQFAGKTCAYAFFFVPGAADIFIRTWAMSPERIRRAADGLGLPRRNTGDSDDIVALFPPKLAAFGWTSPKTIWNSLKQVPKVPLMIAGILPLAGDLWRARWKGEDTDLLFVFYRQYHILADSFMPSGLPLTEKARSPTFALVHAQILSIVDDVIHRHAAVGGPAVMDPMPGADASAMAMQLPPPNLMKGMSENGLVVLLREMLTDDTPGLEGAKHTFAESCAAMMKAAVLRTSQFDNAACFTLCDFLEEALAIFDDFEDVISSKKQYIDWPFWMDVLKRIFASQNTMSEVRVLSFIYSIWEMVAEDPSRKASICLDWLLTEQTFNDYFNHWCPMVRAYYQRLLCWRICRCEGDADEVDTSIFSAVAARLKTTWAHHLYQKQQAQENGRLPPSTAPMVPTPGKKFMIIRQEVAQPQPGLFVNFDSMAKNGGEIVITDEAATDLSNKADAKKKWSLFGKVLGLGSGAKGHERQPSWDEEFINARRETAEQRTRANIPQKIVTSGASKDLDSACSSPMYEEQKYVFKFFLAWHQPAMPPRDRILSRPRLPAPAQAVWTLKAQNLGEVFGTASNSSDSTLVAPLEETGGSVEEAQNIPTEPETQPTKPLGFYTKNTVYSGRALAEWGQVIWECNNFVERRRDEGVPGLCEVEVPTLGVDTFRKPFA